MRSKLLLALLAGATLAHAQTGAPAASAPPTAVSQAKKELVAKALALQQPAFENMAREVVLRPAMQLGQAAVAALQNIPQDKREAAGKSIDTDIRKYIDESLPVLRERAIKLAASTIGPILEEKMSEDELRQLVGWLDSPTARRYQQLGAEMQQAMGPRLLTEAGPLLTPKLQALEQKVRTTLGLPPQGSAGASAPAAKVVAPAKKAASK